MAVPDSFFAILIDPLKYPHDRITNINILPVEIPQNAGYTQLEKKYVTTIAKLEQKTKLRFFSGLTKSERSKIPQQTSKDFWLK